MIPSVPSITSPPLRNKTVLRLQDRLKQSECLGSRLANRKRNLIAYRFSNELFISTMQVLHIVSLRPYRSFRKDGNNWFPVHCKANTTITSIGKKSNSDVRRKLVLLLSDPILRETLFQYSMAGAIFFPFIFKIPFRICIIFIRHSWEPFKYCELFHYYCFFFYYRITKVSR